VLQATTSVRQLLGRVLRLSCPACGRGRIFRRFFLRAENCAGCQRRFEREEGYWVGGSEVHMFASFGLSVLVCVPVLVLLEPTPLLQAGVILGHVVLSLLAFRYSRAIFLALDWYLDPAAPAGGGDDPGGAAAGVRPRPSPGLALRRAPKGRGSRRGREPVDVR
jgi:uncharacterized protein (DUF983 family)